MGTLDLTGSHFARTHLPEGITEDMGLLISHVENHRIRHGSSPDHIAITPSQYAVVMPFLTPPAQHLWGIPIEIT